MFAASHSKNCLPANLCQNTDFFDAVKIQFNSTLRCKVWVISHISGPKSQIMCIQWNWITLKPWFLLFFHFFKLRLAISSISANRHQISKWAGVNLSWRASGLSVHSLALSKTNIEYQTDNRYYRLRNRIYPKNISKCQKVHLFDFDHYLAEVGR